MKIFIMLLIASGAHASPKYSMKEYGHMVYMSPTQAIMALSKGQPVFRDGAAMVPKKGAKLSVRLLVSAYQKEYGKLAKK